MPAVDGQLGELLSFLGSTGPQFGNTEQSGRVAEAVDATVENQVIARVFAQRVNSASQPPRDGVVEKDGFQSALNNNREMIPPP